MPSPFPGMDPYLEKHWRDIHARLIIYACDAIQGTLPASLRARVEESVLLETPTGIADHPLMPDVRVVEFASRRVTETAPGASIAVAEPELVEVDADPATETFIEIIDRESGNRVVTVIEFLSPSNKSPGRNRDQYERKQREICSSDSNLVEIDLNRFGTHALAFPLGNLKKSGRTPYMASVRRPGGLAEVYAMPLWERLRTIKIPLRPTDADVPLDLQPLIDQCYRNGGYEGTLDYSVDPEPPLVGSEKEWAETMLLEKGLRTKKPAPRKRKPK
jgi:Protein of unknown function (DUF4058)